MISLIEGLPAGLTLDLDLINGELRRRQGGYGRGGRQKIETDTAHFLTGVRQGQCIGSPLVVQIANRDSRLDQTPALYKPRPGHADLAGAEARWPYNDVDEVITLKPAPCLCFLRAESRTQNIVPRMQPTNGGTSHSGMLTI